MRKHTFALAGGLALLAALPLVWFAARQQPLVLATAHNVGTADYKISGPYTHKNLSVFLIHDGAASPAGDGKTFLTLSEALAQKKVVVYETKSVNELSIENLSNDEVFVQSGDIVKGGQQDRMLAVDLILPARSGKVSIAAFCVEQGRWSKRGAEEVSRFSSSTERVATRELKLAANKSRSQGEVWARVSEAQSKLGKSVGGSVTAVQSASSYQLTLENGRVRQTTDEYVRALAGIAARHPDAVGYAFAVNGKLNSADLYASHALFAKLWPALIKASAVEAITESQPGRTTPTASTVAAGDVRAFLVESERGAASAVERGAATARVRVLTRETQANILFETLDLKSKSGWVHKSYIKK